MAFFVLESSSGGRAASARQGNTGAPGESSTLTCVNCHGNTIGMTMDIDLLDDADNVMTEYIPDQSYRVRVRLNHVSGTAPRAFGFQMVCLDAPLNTNGEDLENWLDQTTNNYKIASTRGRQYVEHDRPSSQNEFLVEWTAPPANTGEVSFYAAGNGVNLNGGTSGDGSAVSKLEISERVTTSTISQTNSTLVIAPNPATDVVSIEWGIAITGKMRIVDLLGKKVYTQNIVNGSGLRDLDVSNYLSKGVYIVTIDDGVSLRSGRLVKR